MWLKFAKQKPFKEKPESWIMFSLRHFAAVLEMQTILIVPCHPLGIKQQKKNCIETNGNTKHTLILGQEESKEKEGAENLLRSVHWDLCKMSSI